ncbi:hypothetical protein GCM10007100_04310 [Roseibacillus persicicus]|uniref:Uncharacterized protein n=2 Tax=Roseibacillus persicicus TaxID=454148 RepID=A0A918TFB5_9BACT|nr:hypothetical protein GCM10007100_04310 [Roseibacillus persicicus]
MPHLVEMDKRNRKKGLRIIAPERQNSSEEDIKKVTDEYKVEYTISRGTSGPVSTRGIPHAFVFDATGQLVFSGHPGNDDFERTVKKALREVKDVDEKKSSLIETTGPLINQRTWTNSEGKSIVATAMDVEGENVNFKMKNGRIVSYPIAQLSEDDQALLKEAAENPADE